MLPKLAVIRPFSTGSPVSMSVTVPLRGTVSIGTNSSRRSTPSRVIVVSISPKRYPAGTEETFSWADGSGSTPIVNEVGPNLPSALVRGATRRPPSSRISTRAKGIPAPVSASTTMPLTAASTDSGGPGTGRSSSIVIGNDVAPHSPRRAGNVPRSDPVPSNVLDASTDTSAGSLNGASGHSRSNVNRPSVSVVTVTSSNRMFTEAPGTAWPNWSITRPPLTVPVHLGMNGKSPASTVVPASAAVNSTVRRIPQKSASVVVTATDSGPPEVVVLGSCPSVTTPSAPLRPSVSIVKNSGWYDAVNSASASGWSVGIGRRGSTGLGMPSTARPVSPASAGRTTSCGEIVVVSSQRANSGPPVSDT